MASRLLAAAALMLLPACGGAGSYELHWTLGCKSGPSSCVVKSMLDCSRRGIDSVEAFARPASGGDERRSLFPCFSAEDGPLGRGPGLAAGATELTVYGLAAGGTRLTAVVVVTAQIPEDGLVPVQVDIPDPPQCRDGVDNDLDGMVDLFDSDCVDGTDLDESG